jgi:hypothetical protein
MPFLPPRPTTVSTLWPWSAAARSTGSCSSRRARTRRECRAGEFERRDRLAALHGWELAKKLVDGLAALEVVKQRLDRDSSTDEHRDPPRMFGSLCTMFLSRLMLVAEYTGEQFGRMTPVTRRQTSAAPDAGR